MLALVLLVAVAVARAEAPDRPVLEPGPDGWVLARLPPILDDERVREHLQSGLTTTLALHLELRPGPVRREGGALVTVRYDLWDEVFRVASLDASGRPEQRVLADLAELASWWRELRLAPFSGSGRGPPPDRLLEAARLSIDIVPFSAAEARETQRWFSETLEGSGRSSAESVPSAEAGGDTLGRAFRLMMATSIRRRSIHVYRYDVHIGSSRDAGKDPTP